MSNVSTQRNEKPRIRYFHGGNQGLQVGDYILPPDVAPGADFVEHPLHQKDRVYVSTALAHAHFFASARPSPIVYEVEPEGTIEPDPDCNVGISFTCPKAKVVAIHEIPRTEVEKYQAMMRARQNSAVEVGDP
jgi:hypothetical protein